MARGAMYLQTDGLRTVVQERALTTGVQDMHLPKPIVHGLRRPHGQAERARNPRYPLSTDELSA